MISLLLILKQLWENKFVIALAALFAVIFAFYAYREHATSKIDSLNRDNQQLQKTIEEQQKKIEIISQNYELIIKSRDELTKQIEQSQKDIDELREKLNREDKGKKSLGELARKKPKLVENAINKATQKEIECFEILSRGGDC